MVQLKPKKKSNRSPQGQPTGASGRRGTEAAVDDYLRRLQSFGPDKVLKGRIDAYAKDHRRPA